GGVATVVTTEGDRLALRDGPGAGYAALMTLAEGQQVAVLGGPVVDPDGAPWYQVTALELTGWCAGEWLASLDGVLRIGGTGGGGRAGPGGRRSRGGGRHRRARLAHPRRGRPRRADLRLRPGRRGPPGRQRPAPRRRRRGLVRRRLRRRAGLGPRGAPVAHRRRAQPTPEDGRRRVRPARARRSRARARGRRRGAAPPRRPLRLAPRHPG